MSNKEISPIYLVAVTADITKQNIKKCKISGFQKILTKPIINEKLKEILDEWK